ncbi:OmpH family outer membrane protein [Deinococcus radiophilus]|uniref:OmpH family outer membrane protein n=1 Tax=Deinococcus radiophilus TaxID=32062 RepID=A0A3S0LAH7_9DEIO|nr:OmpH family outer membrane protein [Deinococcus radiophilus]RTR30772.1 OmpH family outer membrane protein [Deinococcus radiophilus]UFA51328.1 OmpH family outer membrane protein [Deinococcus radiophilus]
MNKAAKVLLPLSAVAAVAAATVVPSAQTPAQKVGFVDVDRVFAAHPQATAINSQIKTIEGRANTELGALRQQMITIAEKGNSATPAERQQLSQLETTFQSKFESYSKQIAQQSAPIESAVDAAISKVAKANGYSVVMDRKVAAQGLVVFAEESNDMTNAVISAVK